MTCNNSQCQCWPTKYFASNSLTCVDRTLNNTSCASDNTCRVDLGLSCQNSFCQCDSTNRFWHGTDQKCVPFLTYAGLGCTVDANCISSQKLSCIVGKCDCVSVQSNETFWDVSVSVCKPSRGYEESCLANSSCRALSEYLFCSGGLCSLLQLNQVCTYDIQCDSRKSLVCIAGICLCPTTHYLSGSTCSQIYNYLFLFFSFLI